MEGEEGVRSTVTTGSGMSRKRPRSPSPLPAPAPVPAVVSGPLDLYEVISNIIVHISDPATLVRAALVNKQWYETAKTPEILEEFCERQPTRFIGFFGEYDGGWELVPMPLPEELSTVPRFLSDSFPPGLRNAKDCVCGHVLLGLEDGFAVKNPFAKKFTLHPLPPQQMGGKSLGNFSLFKDGSPEDIVHLSVTMNQDILNVQLLVYEDEVWTESDGFAMIEIPTQNDEPLCKPALSVNGNVYILSVNGFAIEVGIMDCNVSIIELPGGSFEWGFQQICRAEKFDFLYLHSDGFYIQIWSRSGGSWSQISSIDVLSMFDRFGLVHKEKFTWDASRSGWSEVITIFGITNEAGIIVLGIDGVDGIFMLDKEKQSVVRVGLKSSVASGDLIGNMMIPLVTTWVPNLPNMSN